jgi:DNA-binding XRE family transcriptional regulator
MMTPNVSRKRERPTGTAYRSAVAEVIRSVKKDHRLSNVKLAERIGADPDSIPNWENELTSMDPVKLLIIEDEFGSGSIDPVLEIAGSHTTPVDMGDCADPLPALAHAVHLIATARSVNSPGGCEEVHTELLAMEAALIEARRGTNQLLARIKKIRG